MAKVTVAGGASGSNIALSGNDQVFEVVDGKIEFTTDGGTTYMEYGPGDGKIVFSDGLTVGVRNARAQTATFNHMPI